MCYNTYMKIEPQNKFRLLSEYKKHFKIDDRTIFAWNDVIYTNYDLPKDLIVHEQTHHKQQKEYGLMTWLKRYLNDKDFRLQMEKEAYINQLESIEDKGLREAVKKDSINALCSGLYGDISKEKAEKLLERSLDYKLVFKK